jgi:hypothetical protein
MGTHYLIDTNAVIEFLGDTLPESGSQWLENLVDMIVLLMFYHTKKPL